MGGEECLLLERRDMFSVLGKFYRYTHFVRTRNKFRVRRKRNGEGEVHLTFFRRRHALFRRSLKLSSFSTSFAFSSFITRQARNLFSNFVDLFVVIWITRASRDLCFYFELYFMILKKTVASRVILIRPIRRQIENFNCVSLIRRLIPETCNRNSMVSRRN